MKVERTGGGAGSVGNSGAGSVANSGGTGAAAATAPVHQSDFASALSGVALRQVDGDLRQIMGQLDAAAQNLLREQSVESLREYKSLVRGFMERVVEKLYVMEQRDSSLLSQQGNYKANLKKLDDELGALTEQVLNREEQKDAMTIADRLDGIRGLLLDLLS